jgi:hypothetical protein
MAKMDGYDSLALWLDSVAPNRLSKFANSPHSLKRRPPTRGKPRLLYDVDQMRMSFARVHDEFDSSTRMAKDPEVKQALEGVAHRLLALFQFAKNVGGVTFTWPSPNQS